MIDVQLLRYLLAAADTGSFARAAERFGVKQSTLSKHVLNFELRTGLNLFERSTRGVAPTHLGQRFLRRASQVMADMDALGAESRALASGATGMLRLGFRGSLVTGELAAILRDYREAWPEVDVSAVEQDRSRQIRALERDQLDLAVCAGECSNAGLSSLSLWHEPVMIGLAPDDPLACQERIYWTDLKHHWFVVTASDPGTDLANLILSRLSGPGHQPRIDREAVSSENLASFASAGRVTVSLGRIAQPAARQTILAPVHDAHGGTTMAQSVHWRRDNPNPALRRFLALVERRYARAVD